MKLCITKIHLGRYKIEMLGDDNQILYGADMGSAGVYMAIGRFIFADEHEQYGRDQRKSSNELGNEAIQKMLIDPTINPKGLKPPSAKLYFEYAAQDCPGHVASYTDPYICGRCGLDIRELI